MTDARFADGAEQPLRLRALEPGDLTVISALVQDGVFLRADMRFARKARRFAVLLNRFRWEHSADAISPPERVRAMLVIEGAMAVQARGLPQGDDIVLSLLSLEWQAAASPEDDPGGRLVLTLAGDAELAVTVEALEVVLQDVTRPYAAPSGHSPRHPD